MFLNAENRRSHRPFWKKVDAQDHAGGGRHDKIIIVQSIMINMQTTIQKPEGILVPTSVLEEAGINGIPKIHITKHAIILQSTSNTRRFAGRLRKSPISAKQLDEVYDMHLLED